MANKNFGRRMVDEESITKIGKGGGGTPIEAGTGISITGTDTKTIAVDNTVALKTDITTYTAGTGIDITEGEISVDTQVIATKEDLGDYQYRESFEFTDNPFTTEGWLTKVPVLATNNFTPATDAKFGNNPVIDLTTSDASRRFAYAKGYFVMRDTTNDVFTVYATTNSTISSSTTANDLQTVKILRGGSTDWSFYDTYYRDTQTITDYDSNSVTIIRLGTRTTSTMNGGPSGLTQGTYFVKLAGNSIAANKNYPNGFQVPTTQGTYVLNAIVDSASKLNKFEWAAPQVASPVYEYAVYFEFNKSGTGAAYYSVYFNLKSTTEYDPQNIDFTTLRSLIIANGNHVVCNCQTSAGTLDMNMISTSTNAGDDTILVDSKSGDFFEFYSFNDLTNHSITKLNY